MGTSTKKPNSRPPILCRLDKEKYLDSLSQDVKTGPQRNWKFFTFLPNRSLVIVLVNLNYFRMKLSLIPTHFIAHCNLT